MSVALGMLLGTFLPPLPGPGKNHVASQSGGGASLRHRLPSEHASGARFFAGANVGEMLEDHGGEALDSIQSTSEDFSQTLTTKAGRGRFIPWGAGI
jgi:hypothetical protein